MMTELESHIGVLPVKQWILEYYDRLVQTVMLLSAPRLCRSAGIHDRSPVDNDRFVARASSRLGALFLNHGRTRTINTSF